jgi:hypothetical protein
MAPALFAGDWAAPPRRIFRGALSRCSSGTSRSILKGLCWPAVRPSLSSQLLLHLLVEFILDYPIMKSYPLRTWYQMTAKEKVMSICSTIGAQCLERFENRTKMSSESIVRYFRTKMYFSLAHDAPCRYRPLHFVFYSIGTDGKSPSNGTAQEGYTPGRDYEKK